jgi:L-glyceraldehyde 3-phosphate reductase
MAWQPADTRYDTMKYNRLGKSGLKLPAISLGLWHNFGGDTRHDLKREICRTAFDLGITHFDLANNYGPPPGSAETAFGEILRREYMIASCDQSLKRTGLDYFDIFYSHRFDPDTPLEETMLALDHIVRSGRALYVGISSYNSRRTREAYKILKELGTPFVIHQPSYSMINRWIEEDGLIDTLEDLGLGSIVFSPLAQGMLTSKYLGGLPDGSRATQEKSLNKDFLNEKNVENIRKLNSIAEKRGQTLAQMALAWVLRGGHITSALIGASKPSQVVDCVAAIDKPDFTKAELEEIDKYAREADINLWAASAERKGPARKKK